MSVHTIILLFSISAAAGAEPPPSSKSRHQAGVILDGSEITRDQALRIEETRYYGFADRASRYDYDKRGRLEESILVARTGEGAGQDEPRVAHSVTDADFVER